MDNAIRFKFMLFTEYLKGSLLDREDVKYYLLLNHSVTISVNYLGFEVSLICSKEDFLADGFTIAFYIPRLNVLVYKITEFLDHLNTYVFPIAYERNISYKERQKRMDIFRDSIFNTVKGDRDEFRVQYWNKMEEITEEYPLIDSVTFRSAINDGLEKIKSFYI